MSRRGIQFETYGKWDDLGLTQKFQRENIPLHSDIIIGLVDTGICPTMECFSDEGLEPLPSYKIWKGGSNVVDFSCNKKIVGSKVYANDEEKGYDEIFDYTGHGTYMAYIASGDFLCVGKKNITRGAIPKSRIAMYKFHTWTDDCVSKGMLDAVRDGVDVLCMALSVCSDPIKQKASNKEKHVLGKRSSALLTQKKDFVTRASLYATVKGILCVVSAGNHGVKGTVASYAPWQLCVGAYKRSNCEFVAVIKFGDGKGSMKGYSMNKYSTGFCSLIYEDNARVAASSCSSSQGKPAFDPEKVNGKILICKGSREGRKAKTAGAKGIIVIQKKRDEIDSRNKIFPLSAAIVTKEDAKRLKNYIDEQIKNQRVPTAEILACVEEIIGDNEEHPTLLPFSSRGPLFEPDLLKPNICAPGELFTPSIPSKGVEEGTSLTLVCGTSPATAFVAGAAGVIKSLHPDWSPAVIISAIMTTASPMRKIDDEDVYGIGNGMIDPLAALDPGLVYDIPVGDWVKYLRWTEYKDDEIHQNIEELRELVGSVQGVKHVRDLNLPSFSAAFYEDETRYNFIRTLKNITKGASKYQCKVEQVEGLHIEIHPKELFFKGFEDEQTFGLLVDVIDWSKSLRDAFSTFLEWRESESDLESKHVVRGHILITRRTS